jgi:hypothetical protein
MECSKKNFRSANHVNFWKHQTKHSTKRQGDKEKRMDHKYVTFTFKSQVFMQCTNRAAV